MPAYIWYPAFAGLTVGFSFMNIPPLANQFMELFGVGYAGLSLFLSGLIWSHAFMQIPSRIIVDRIGIYRSVIISCGIGVFTLGSRVLPPVFMGTALGLLNTVANIANVGLTLLFGNIREHTGSFGPALICVGVAAAAVWLVTRKAVRRVDEAVR